NILRARSDGCTPSNEACAHSRILLTTHKSTAVQWSEDGSRYAYSKEGRVFVASISDTTPRQVAGPPTDTRKETPQDTSRDARDRRDRERYRVVRYGPANDALVVANSQGYWLLDLPSA